VVALLGQMLEFKFGDHVGCSASHQPCSEQTSGAGRDACKAEGRLGSEAAGGGPQKGSGSRLEKHQRLAISDAKAKLPGRSTWAGMRGCEGSRDDVDAG
ncbi:hypothetical protein, partial [Leptothrix ochracea]|uniref:hypothetical protein n=1 Tax=Leptothrix ochracea TaxID=735331 RepID=UPI0034E25673